MPITTEFDAKAGIRTHRVTGALFFDELRETLAAVYASPEYHANQSVLWDLRDADLTGFSTKEVGGIAGMVRAKWASTGTARAALVVARTVDFGMARMYEQWLGAEPEDRVQVFQDLDEGLAWLLGTGSATP